jgi:hypothetical protein
MNGYQVVLAFLLGGSSTPQIAGGVASCFASSINQQLTNNPKAAMTQYARQIKAVAATTLSFKAICDYNIRIFPHDGYDRYYRSLQNGTGLLNSHEQMNTYMACYADMHRVKLNKAFDRLFANGALHGKTIEVIDWGCGQAFAACTLIDYVREHGIANSIRKITLIEPSAAALNRGWEHLDALHQGVERPQIVMINKSADATLVGSLSSEEGIVKLHLFSNILDIDNLNLEMVKRNVLLCCKGVNYMVCVSPSNLGSNRLRLFRGSFRGIQPLDEHTLPIQAEVFRPSKMRRIPFRVTCIRCIFKIYN